jgi:hypothetical protein
VRAAAPVILRLEELEGRAVPAHLGLLGSGSAQQPTADGLLAFTGSTLSSVTSLVDRLAVLVADSVSLDLSRTPASSHGEGNGLAVAKGPGHSRLAVSAGLGDDSPIVQVNVANPATPPSDNRSGGDGNSGGTQVVVTLPAPLAGTPVGLAATAVNGTPAGNIQVGQQPPATGNPGPANPSGKNQATGPSDDLASLAAAVNQQQTAVSESSGNTTPTVPPVSANRAEALPSAARPATAGVSNIQVLPAVDRSSLLFAPGGQTAALVEPTAAPAFQAAGTTITPVPETPRTLPQPAGVAEDVDPPPADEPDLISSCPSQVPPALDALMAEVNEGLSTFGMNWMQWTPWLALLAVGAAAYGIGRRRRTEATLGVPLTTETLTL